ncbi:hypothetical protein Syncc8109_0096 [Synechococcus sp. WH 8109]|nr:hypothetical protein Syncc8109_0096 [Synechococcus sp. WH 8109]
MSSVLLLFLLVALFMVFQKVFQLKKIIQLTPFVLMALLS